jgi:hypothetical protein
VAEIGKQALLFLNHSCAARFSPREKALGHRGAKNQKNFAPLRAGVAPAVPDPTGIKVFFASFLFTKKKTLL